MNPDELRAKFPNASVSFLAKNSGEDAVVERCDRDGALAASQTEDTHSGRFLVRVTSRRKRLLDEDNLCEKVHVDCCRHAGVLPSDAPERTSIETRQEKVGSKEPEETVIEIYETTNQERNER